MENTIRVQDPDIFTTEGKDPKWYIRPFIDTFDEQGNPAKKQQRIYLGRCAEVKKREAITKKNEILARINKSQLVLQAQLTLGALLDYYVENYVRAPGRLASPTQGNYERLIKAWIRPAWGDTHLGEMRPMEIEKWLYNLAAPRIVGNKIKPGMAHHTRNDIRNLMSGVFTQARKWSLWKGENPMEFVSAGKKEAVRPARKLTTEETRALLDSLPGDVRIICEVALFGTLRISEVLGLTWKHIDFTRGLIMVRQRFYRGDIGKCKTGRSVRDVPMGELDVRLAAMYPGVGHEDEFVFSVATHQGHYRKARVCRDDRDINQHFLRPAAKALGVYWIGFGFHAFRREAVTAYGQSLGALQAQRMAGHTRADVTLAYTLSDNAAQEKAVRELQARVRGEVVEFPKKV
ncbi:MAG TPA: site-specific integrase [Bryobacteraceae bacterium]|jgi:integrase|nr:site-specific integrase [Bryobacteraceae bacterium]